VIQSLDTFIERGKLMQKVDKQPALPLKRHGPRKAGKGRVFLY